MHPKKLLAFHTTNLHFLRKTLFFPNALCYANSNCHHYYNIHRNKEHRKKGKTLKILHFRKFQNKLQSHSWDDFFLSLPVNVYRISSGWNDIQHLYFIFRIYFYLFIVLCHEEEKSVNNASPVNFTQIIFSAMCFYFLFYIDSSKKSTSYQRLKFFEQWNEVLKR